MKKIKSRIRNYVVFFCPFPKIRRHWRSTLKDIFVYKTISLKDGFYFLLKNVLPINIFKKCPENFSFCKEDNPVVSIIIPVYNQYNYTKLCLWSILRNTKDVSYEIIIADDCSKDKTITIEKSILNIKHIKTPQNLRFLKNCNYASKFANGKYLLFLNNDTQVCENWLKPLVDTIENDEKIGLVGSKLLYPDGHLQEAGGIIFNDAKGCNYGRMQNPRLFKYNYLKQVDYISGASIMISKKLWNEFNGFDETFSPAYYEDTDLAFRVRQRGLKVVFQPLSQVIHFEGKSNGTDLTSGQKKYQVVNKEKFYKKWENILKKEHGTRDDLFLTQNHSLHKKTLFFIDSDVLTPDQDCGSKASFQYLKYFVKSGFNVKFFCLNNYCNKEKYINDIQQLGVEFITFQNSEKYFQQYGQFANFIYLNRPNVAEVFLPIIKKYTNAKIIYQGHDLHFLRLYREYQLSKNSKVMKKSKNIEKIEKEIISKSDATVMFSDFEIQKISEFNPGALTSSVPLYILDINKKKNLCYNPAERSGIMFIGGFRHTPNKDAVIWFVNNVFDKVVKEIPDIKFYIAGSAMPEEIASLKSDNIEILGRISDEELDELYKKIKISVIPLRFGAGVKGKVIDSIYNKVPIITTSIGAEGIPENNLLTIEDDADKFASILIQLYNDNKKLKYISDNSLEFIEKYYSENAIKIKFHKLFKEI